MKVYISSIYQRSQSTFSGPGKSSVEIRAQKSHTSFKLSNFCILEKRWWAFSGPTNVVNRAKPLAIYSHSLRLMFFFFSSFRSIRIIGNTDLCFTDGLQFVGFRFVPKIKKSNLVISEKFMIKSWNTNRTQTNCRSSSSSSSMFVV